MTVDQVLGLAPDAGSAKAGQALASPRKWTAAGTNGTLVWGECQGSGAQPYQTRADLTTLTYKCSCPSRKFPCKHVLGLLLLKAEDAVESAEPPEWVTSWATERAAKAQRPAEKRELPADPAASAAAAAKRAKQRDERVAAGLAECELWLRDVVRLGLAHAQTQPSRWWFERAARLVDAQCPGVARRVRALASIAASGPGWESRLFAALGEIALLCEAYAHLDALPPALRADVRRHVGWTQTQEEILARAVDCVDDVWLVTGTRTEDDERLSVRRSWLRGEGTRRDALILQFSPSGTPFTDPPIAGTRFAARLVYVESAAPLRAVFVERELRDGANPPSSETLDDALSAFARSLGGDPWLERFPFVLADVTPLRRGDGWFVRDGRGRGLPLARQLREPFALHAFARGGPVTVAGEWDGRVLLPLAAWSADRAVSLP